MQFGNWKVTENTIEFAGEGLQRFVIRREDMGETISADAENADLYKWILLATEEDWLTHDDLYDLNFAFVYAAGAMKIPFDYALFDQTIAYQFEALDQEENEQPTLNSSPSERAEAEQQRKDAATGRD